jgi:hypothetical protein
MEKYSKHINYIVPAVGVLSFGVGYLAHSFINPSVQAELAGMQGRAQFGQGTGNRSGQMMARGGGMVQGEIISIDDTGITVKGRDGGSKIVLMSTSTKVFKSVDTIKSDLKVGTNVMVAGTSNPDGSVSASSVSIRNDFPIATSTKQ